MIFALAAAVALAYQLIALFAVLRHRRQRDAPSARFPPVSVLKPLYGLDPGFARAARSHATQQYPDFEILFGVRDPGGPEAAVVDQLQHEFSGTAIRSIVCRTAAQNGKVGALIDLAREARGDILVINDSDIIVSPDYLRRVIAPLEDARVGVVTCLYRASADTIPGRWEALGIAAGFAPGVLVAPLVGVKDIGLGATLVVRASDLHRAGGFEALADYLADDNVLARNIAGLGLRVHLSDVVVETHLGAPGWRHAWRRQLRWFRTIRVTNRSGYAGLPLTFAAMWALPAVGTGQWWLAALVLIVRLAAVVATGKRLACPVTSRWWWLAPIRDITNAILWIAALTGDTVEWRGQHLRLDRTGRIVGVQSVEPVSSR
ncbi:MAG: bacteriohopanetetrol glucosamine biosynthesis glycosyltransferase HpnI [Bryobacteraceae bacterium]